MPFYIKMIERENLKKYIFTTKQAGWVKKRFGTKVEIHTVKIFPKASDNKQTQIKPEGPFLCYLAYERQKSKLS